MPIWKTREDLSALVEKISSYLNIKEVIGMLFIEQVYEKSNIKSDYVRCPSCKRGRLCDKPIGEKATVIALKSGHSERTSSRIILKCPKCSQKFIIHLSKENWLCFVHSSTAGQAEYYQYRSRKRACIHLTRWERGLSS